jgi:general secretion pathway protein D
MSMTCIPALCTRRTQRRHRQLLGHSLRPLALAAVALCAAPLALNSAAQAPASQRQPAGTYTLNFPNSEIENVSRAVSALLNRPILVDPRVRGTITLVSERRHPEGGARS